MTSRTALMRGLVILGIVSAVFLVGCGGGAPTVNNQPPSVAPQPTPATPTSTLLIEATPPAGVTVLSLSLTIMGAALEPGAVPLVTSPVSVEINRLQFETSLMANVPIPAGTYSGLSLTLASPVLTILNNSAAPVGSCASGAICTLNPALVVSSVDLTGQPFPISYDGKSPFILLVDLDLSKSLSLSNLRSLNPSLAVQQIQPAALDQGLFVRQVAGSINYTGGDDVIDGALFDLLTSMGTLHGVSDFSAQYIDANLCGYFYCVQNKIAEVDLTLPTKSDSFWEARRVTLKPPDQPELEGVIVAITNASQFDLILLHQGPPETGLQLGDTVGINLQVGATIEAIDTNLATTGLLFSAPSDLLIGQVVTLRAHLLPTGHHFPSRRTASA